MPSTYSSNLKIELMSTGENSGTWGNITNTNLGTALEQAVVGYGAVSYASDANLTISITNSNAAQAARALVLNVTSDVSLTGTRELVVPTIEKQYIVQNNTTGSQSITVKTSAGTGITVPNGRKAHLYVDGTNVIQMFDFVDINGGTIDGTPIGGSSAAAGSFTTLGASGAATFNGAVTLGDAAADNITFNGTVTSHLLFTDNTYDIGASGATRPRNLFLAGAATIGGNLSVGGTLTLTGGLILNGNVTVGDNASDTLTINSTITSNLLFTDNTYDIGASGATRPRNLFLAGAATIGGNVTTAGRVIVDDTTDSTSATTGSIQTDGGLGIAKALFVGTTVTVNGGTANGVAYLNGSKVLTTGSALTFDGTGAFSLANTGSVISTIQSTSTSGTRSATLRLNVASTGGDDPAGTVSFTYGAGFTQAAAIDVTHTNPTMKFVLGSSEQMRLTGNALGLGTTDEYGRLNVQRYVSSPLSTISLGDFASAGNSVGLYGRVTSGGVFGISTAGAPTVFYLGGPGTTEAMRINTTGLGVATATPVASLTVAGTGGLIAGASPALSATAPAYSGVAFGFDGASNLGQVISTNASGAALGFYTKSGGGSAPAQRMHITGGGFVGVATTTPITALQVNSESLYVLGVKSTTAYGFISLQDGGTSGALTDGTVAVGANVDDLVFRSGGANRARLGNTGNFGLGATATAWLWPDGSTGVLQLQAGAAFSGYNAGAVMSQNWYYNANERFIGNGWATRYSQASGVHSWSSSTASNSSGAGAVLTWAESMRITTAGRIAMGSSSTPQGRLGVWGLTGGSIELSLDSNPNYGEIQTYSSSPLYIQRQGNNVYSNVGGGAFYVGKNNDDITDTGWTLGNAGTGGAIFTVTDNEFFTWNNYNGSGSVQMDFRWNNTEVGSIAYTSSSVSFNQTSDYRLKDDPQPLTNSGAFIDALKPKVWKWKIDGSRGVGFIAHEAQEVSPLSVTGEKDAVRDDGVTPKYQSVAYGSPEFIANIVLELQSLRKRLADAGIA